VPSLRESQRLPTARIVGTAPAIVGVASSAQVWSGIAPSPSAHLYTDGWTVAVGRTTVGAAQLGTPRCNVAGRHTLGCADGDTVGTE
jgi:hypothetical protein